MLWYSLVELPEIPSVVWIQGSSRRRKTFRCLKRLRCVLVELPKTPSIVGRKNLQKAEDIAMVEDVRCKLVELLAVVGRKEKRSKVVDGLASSLILSQSGDYCEIDSKLEKLRFLENSNSGPKWGCLGPEFSLILEHFVA